MSDASTELMANDKALNILPDELLMKIASFVSTSERPTENHGILTRSLKENAPNYIDLWSLCLISKKTNRAFTEGLYTVVHLNGLTITRFIHTMIQHPKLADLVKRVSIYSLSTYGHPRESTYYAPRQADDAKLAFALEAGLESLFTRDEIYNKWRPNPVGDAVLALCLLKKQCTELLYIDTNDWGTILPDDNGFSASSPFNCTVFEIVVNQTVRTQPLQVQQQDFVNRLTSIMFDGSVTKEQRYVKDVAKVFTMKQLRKLSLRKFSSSLDKTLHHALALKKATTTDIDTLSLRDCTFTEADIKTLGKLCVKLSSLKWVYEVGVNFGTTTHHKSMGCTSLLKILEAFSPKAKSLTSLTLRGFETVQCWNYFKVEAEMDSLSPPDESVGQFQHRLLSKLNFRVFPHLEKLEVTSTCLTGHIKNNGLTILPPRIAGLSPKIKQLNLHLPLIPWHADEFDPTQHPFGGFASVMTGPPAMNANMNVQAGAFANLFAAPPPGPTATANAQPVPPQVVPGQPNGGLQAATAFLAANAQGAMPQIPAGFGNQFGPQLGQHFGAMMANMAGPPHAHLDSNRPEVDLIRSLCKQVPGLCQGKNSLERVELNISQGWLDCDPVLRGKIGMAIERALPIRIMINGDDSWAQR